MMHFGKVCSLGEWQETVAAKDVGVGRDEITKGHAGNAEEKVVVILNGSITWEEM